MPNENTNAGTAGQQAGAGTMAAPPPTNAPDSTKTAEVLFREADMCYELAAQASGEGNLEQAKSYEAQGDTKTAEANKLQTVLDVEGRLATKRGALRSSLFPAALPQAGDGTGPMYTLDNVPLLGAMKQLSADEYREKVASVYQIRYGEQSDAVTKVLQDLHGSDYKTMRLQHYDTFARYLRDYKVNPSRDDDLILRDLVLGPSQVEGALKSGNSVEDIKATLVEAIDTLGGYIVPVDFQEEILRRIRGMTVMRGRAATSTTSRDRVELPKLTGGDQQFTTSVRVTWTSEIPVAGVSETDLEWGLEEIQIHTVMAETFLSRNLVEDAAVDLVGELTTAYAEAQAIDEDNRFITGHGAGVPQGILVNGTTPITGVAVKNSGAAAGLTSDGVINLQYGIASQYRGSAVWIMARETAGVIRKFKTGDGQYIWEDSFQAGQPALLLGSPVLEQEVMPAVAAGTHPLLYGDPRGYRIVDRIGMSVERFLDSETARRNRVLYVMRRRLGGQLTHPERWAAQLVAL